MDLAYSLVSLERDWSVYAVWIVLNIEFTGRDMPSDLANSSQSERQAVFLMYPSEEEDVINFLQLFTVLWRRKWLIATVMALFVLVGTAYAFLATPIYRVETVLAPNESEQGSSLPSGLGGLANLAGITLGSSADNSVWVATLRSRVFVEDFINDKNLLPVLFADKWDAANKRWIEDDPEDQPNVQDGVTFFIEEVRSVSEDATGLVTLTIDWTDPQLAVEWSAELVNRINERLRARDLEDSKRRLEYLKRQLENTSLVELRQAISQLIENEIQTITLAQVEREYAFKVVDPPRVPSTWVAPRRLLIIVLAAFVGGIIGILLALLYWNFGSYRRETAANG